MQPRFLTIFAVILLSLALISAGCSPDTPAFPSTVAPATPLPAPSAADPTGTLTPTATQEAAPETTGRYEVVLLAPPGANPDLAASLETILSELAFQEELEFERVEGLEPDDLDSGTRLVAVIGPDPGLAKLAAAAPQVQFLNVDIPDITTRGNLSSLAANSAPSEQLGFLAGYLAAMVTPEWRVGVLAPSDTTAGVSTRQGFLNGVVFFCGLCRQTYPPFITYPLYAELPSTATPAEWQAAAQSLVDQSVQTIYLAPGADNEEIAAYLGEAGVELIAGGPPPAGIKDHWVASLQFDTVSALRLAWPSLISGEGESVKSMPITANYVNEEILTPGRLRLVEEMAASLDAGFIDPGAGPAGDNLDP